MVWTKRSDGSEPSSNRSGRDWLLLTLAAVALFLLRVPFLPPTLDDLDSLNFDLGVHDYDASAHRPHPPGYPIFILLAKPVHFLVGNHAAALALLSVLFGSLSVFPLYFLMRELASRRVAALASLLTVTCPVVWFNGVRPMSDLTGLFAVLTSQGLLVRGALGIDRQDRHGQRFWYLGVVAAGLAMGVRLQALWLVGPVLLFGWARSREVRWGSIWCMVGSLAIWAVPMVYLSGGPATYIQSLNLTLREALEWEPLVSAFTIRRAMFSFWDVLGAPWGPSWLALPVLAAAAAGGALWLRMNRRALAWTCLIVLPYALYHYFFQWSQVLRYAIPITPFVALLAAVAVVKLTAPSRAATAVVGLAFATASAAWTLPALTEYHQVSSPAARALASVRRFVGEDVVVSGHHVFGRHLSSLPPDLTVLSTVPTEEWRPLFRYWKEGGRRPLLYLGDPMRTTLLLMGGGRRTSLGQWRWSPRLERLLQGERPLQVELTRLDPPSWFADSGFLMSPEAGSPSEVAAAHHVLYVEPMPTPRPLIVSGTLTALGETELTLHVGEAVYTRWQLGGAFTVRTMLDGLPGDAYVPVSFVSPKPVLFTDVWLDDEAQPAIQPGRGFYLPERAADARLFRWVAPEAEATVYLPSTAAFLTIRGWIPVKYYQLPVTLRLNWNGRPLASLPISDSTFQFQTTLSMPAGGDRWGSLELSSSHRFVPDERQWNGDHRVLAIRIDELSLTPTREAPAAAATSEAEEQPRTDSLDPLQGPPPLDSISHP